MIKNRLKLSLATAMLLSTCAYGGTVTAPNSVNIEASGDIELKCVMETTKPARGSDTTVQKRTAEAHLAFVAKLEGGTKVFTKFTAYDANQGDADADSSLTTKHAYAVIPLMGGKGKIVAGLAPNSQYGTPAFEGGGEGWKLAVNMPIAKGVKVTAVTKVKNEEEQDKNQGDSAAVALRIDAKLGDFMVGAKYVNAYLNKNDGFTGNKQTELEAKVIVAYVTGKVAGFKVGAEFVTKELEKVGAPAKAQFKKDPSGFYLSVSKEIGNINAGISYLSVFDHMNGGKDFALGMILDGNLNASATKDTTAIAIPVTYAVNKSVEASLKLISIDYQGVDAMEIDLGVEYKVNDNIAVALAYGQFDGKKGCSIVDTQNVELAVAIEF